MKQGVVFVLASAALISAVITAHVMAPLPEGGPFQASAKTTATSETPPLASRPVLDTAAAKPLIEGRQAPVPLQMRERPAAILPASAETAAATMPASSMPAEVEGGGFAKSAIEADGYKSVKNIVAGPDGTWRARALRGRTEVVLTVDQEGRVSAE